jgi:hypothetical protein
VSIVWSSPDHVVVILRLFRSLDLDSKLLQVLIMLNVGGNSVTNDFCAFFTILLSPLGKELLIRLGRFLLYGH